MNNYKSILEKQQLFFKTHQSKDIAFRKQNLLKFKEMILRYQEKFYEAIAKDFGKSKIDTYTTELAILLNEIDYYVKYLSKLNKPKSKWNTVLNLPGKSKLYYEPLGNTLIIGTWNYPFQLTLAPVIAAIAAGNTVIMKPSENAKNSMLAIAEAINNTFNEEYVYCVCGGVPEITELLTYKFDKIFFTGSSRVGKIIYEAAAKQLTPVTLELGGKSPAIVTKYADLDVSAKRIVWGKFLNSGQTCIAPDYLLVEESIKEEFVELIKKYIQKFDYKVNDNFTQIINEHNFDRLVDLIDTDKVIYGGKHNRAERYIEPTVIDNVSLDDAIMQEEIFGPLMPILTIDSFNDCYDIIAHNPKPLSAYLFSNNKAEQKGFAKNILFGGGFINNTVMHLTNHKIPFGGVGDSGIGNYHGKFGFETFTHQKPIMTQATWGEPDYKYPPYKLNKMILALRFLRNKFFSFNEFRP